MDQALTLLRKKLQEREDALSQVRKLLLQTPEGSLEVMHRNGRPRFYLLSGGKRTYLKKEKEKLITGLAEKNYYERLETALNGEVSALSAFLKKYHPNAGEQVYERLSADRKALVEPFFETDEQVVLLWQEEMEDRSLLGKNTFESSNMIRTKQGEMVRSKSEKIIADALYDHGIPYFYELPLRLKRNTVYPDFTALNVRTRKTWYWEHFGLCDSPEYMEKAVAKTEAYRQSGIWPGDGLIQTFETQRLPLSTDAIEASIRKYLL